MTIVKALKALYERLGGAPSDVANATRAVDVLNAIAALYGGASNATHIAKAIANIVAVASGLIKPSGAISITENGSGIDVAQYATANVSVDDGSATIAGLVDRNITSMVIPDGVKTIGLDAFSKCGYLADVSIPNSVTRISQGAFQHCIALHELVIPDSVIMFQSGTFTGSGLTDIYYTGTQVQWEAIASLSDAGIPQGCTIHYEYTPTP